MRYTLFLLRNSAGSQSFLHLHDMLMLDNTVPGTIFLHAFKDTFWTHNKRSLGVEIGRKRHNFTKKYSSHGLSSGIILLMAVLSETMSIVAHLWLPHMPRFSTKTTNFEVLAASVILFTLDKTNWWLSQQNSIPLSQNVVQYEGTNQKQNLLIIYLRFAIFLQPAEDTGREHIKVCNTDGWKRFVQLLHNILKLKIKKQQLESWCSALVCQVFILYFLSEGIK